MNYLGILIGLIMIHQAEAQTCAPASKEMAQYLSQKSWRPHSVNGANGVQSVTGYVDGENNFYFSDLSRGGAARSKVVVDSSNRGYSEFFKYCRSGKSSYLRSMRRSEENNRYHISMRYLPELNGFANDPIKALNYKEHKAGVRLKFEADSSFDTLESYPARIKTQLLNQLNEQVSQQKELGVIELNLTGFDDVVCDLLQGRLKIWLNREGISTAPIVEQKREIAPEDVQVVYRALRDQVSSSLGKEKAIFSSARLMAKLEADRRIDGWVEKRGFEVLKKVMNPEMSRVVDMDDVGLSCLSDQIQSYSRGVVTNMISVQFQMPSIDEVESTSSEKQ